MKIPSTTHDLRAWPVYFEQTWLGFKPFDIRYDDRGYQRGDVVRIREWDQRGECACHETGRKHHDETHCDRYSGRVIRATIGFLCAAAPGPHGRRGFNGDGYVVLGLVDVSREDGRRLPDPAPALVPSPVLLDHARPRTRP